VSVDEVSRGGSQHPAQPGDEELADEMLLQQ
jgi:hypothetical protein